jgi:hypothetical protein
MVVIRVPIMNQGVKIGMTGLLPALALQREDTVISRHGSQPIFHAYHELRGDAEKSPERGFFFIQFLRLPRPARFAHLRLEREEPRLRYRGALDCAEKHPATRYSASGEDASAAGRCGQDRPDQRRAMPTLRQRSRKA